MSWALNTDGGYWKLLEIFSKPSVCYTWEATTPGHWEVTRSENTIKWVPDRHPPLPQACLSLPDVAAFMRGVPYRMTGASNDD